MNKVHLVRILNIIHRNRKLASYNYRRTKRACLLYCFDFFCKRKKNGIIEFLKNRINITLSRANKARTNSISTAFFNRTEVIKFQADRIVFEYMIYISFYSYSHSCSSYHIFININVSLIYAFTLFPVSKLFHSLAPIPLFRYFIITTIVFTRSLCKFTLLRTLIRTMNCYFTCWIILRIKRMTP